MPIFTDQTGRTLAWKWPPKKIISLVPSQTEFLFDLGLDTEVIGITKFCIHPEQWFHKKKRIGGTKNIDINLIHLLQPDLIIGNIEENTKEQIEELEKNYPVWISDVKTLEDALSMMEELGRITERLEKAEKITGRIKDAFADNSAGLAGSPDSIQLPGSESNLRPRLTIQDGVRSVNAAYLIWRNPYLTVGGDTFIHDMMKHCKLSNIFGGSSRYPEINISELNSGLGRGGRNCELLLLPSEPFPFKEKHRLELQYLLPDTEIILVDGEMFSWYGSRLLFAASYFRKLLQQIHR